MPRRPYVNSSMNPLNRKCYFVVALNGSFYQLHASVVSYKKEARTLRVWDGNRQQPITWEVFSP